MENSSIGNIIISHQIECFRIIRKLFLKDKKRCILILSTNNKLIEIVPDSIGDVSSQKESYSLGDIIKVGTKINENTGILTLSFKNKKTRVYEMDEILMT